MVSNFVIVISVSVVVVVVVEIRGSDGGGVVDEMWSWWSKGEPTIGLVVVEDHLHQRRAWEGRSEEDGQGLMLVRSRSRDGGGGSVSM